MGRGQEPLIYSIYHRIDHAPLQIEAHDGDIGSCLMKCGTVVLRAAQLIESWADEIEAVSGVLEVHGYGLGEVLDDSHAGYDRRGIHRALGGLVVEADVAGDYGHRLLLVFIALEVEVLAGFGYALHSFSKLPEGLRLFRIAVVEAVGEGGGDGSYGGHISHGLGHGGGSSPEGADAAVEGIAVHGQGHAEFFAAHRGDEAGVGLARPDHGIAHDLGIIVAVDMLSGGDVG